MDAKWIGDHNTRKFGTEVFRGGLTMKPGDYIDRNCWLGASTMHQTEIDRRYGIGIGNLMWGNDFPHPEGTWPHTREWLRMRFHDAPSTTQDPRAERGRLLRLRRRARAARRAHRPDGRRHPWRRTRREGSV
jgi:hypothetical protein